MEVYMYDADLYCEDCGAKICDEINAERKTQGKEPLDADDATHDSGEYPVSYPDAGESDTPSHCGECHKFLENPLTDDGHNYVCEKIIEHLASGGKRGCDDVLLEWIEFYDITLDNLMEYVSE